MIVLARSLTIAPDDGVVAEEVAPNDGVGEGHMPGFHRFATDGVLHRHGAQVPRLAIAAASGTLMLPAPCSIRP